MDEYEGPGASVLPTASQTHGGSAIRSSTLAQVMSGWRLILVVFVLLAAAGLAYVRLAPDTYTASAVISFQPRKGDVTGRDLAALLAQRYPELAASTDSIAAAAKAAGVSPSQVRKGLSAAIPPTTLNLLMSVGLPDPEQAKAAADSIYSYVIAGAATDPVLEAVPVSSPSVGTAPSGTPKSVLYLAVLFLSAFVAILIQAIRVSRRNSRNLRS